MKEKVDGRGQDFSRQSELTGLSEVRIHDETDRLRKAAIWGQVGAEIVLTQLYPPQISLFRGDSEMNIFNVKSEIKNFRTALIQAGVQIVQVRDYLAENLVPRQGLTRDKLLKGIIRKTKENKPKYGNKILDRQHVEVLDWLIQEDVERFGETQALTLNWLLSIGQDLPLGNSIYARDQMNVILGKMIKCSMKEPIRRPEVALYNRVYRDLGLTSEVIDIPSPETFEGGDAFVHAKTVYVGVGARTSFGAAKYIYEALREDLDKAGFKFVIVEEENPEIRSRHDEMSFMHLDTFFNPIGENEVVVGDGEASRKTVKILTTDDKGNTQTISTGKSFIEFLADEGQRIMMVPLPEQKSFGCNFLTIDKNTGIVPYIRRTRMIDWLRTSGKKVIRVPLTESTDGYGAAHCMVGQLVRNQI